VKQAAARSFLARHALNPHRSVYVDFEDDPITGQHIYRYGLRYTWDLHLPRVAWIMLNPSFADGVTLDKTMTRVLDFSERFGFGGSDVANLFALISTDPKTLATHADPVGPRNDAAILRAAADAAHVILAYGPGGALGHRDARVGHLLQSMGHKASCLGLTQAGYPKHPLRLAKTTDLVSFPL
jgi:hypothetical protein